MFLTTAGLQVILGVLGVVFLGLCVDLARALLKGDR